MRIPLDVWNTLEEWIGVQQQTLINLNRGFTMMQSIESYPELLGD